MNRSTTKLEAGNDHWPAIKCGRLVVAAFLEPRPTTPAARILIRSDGKGGCLRVLTARRFSVQVACKYSLPHEMVAIEYTVRYANGSLNNC